MKKVFTRQEIVEAEHEFMHKSGLSEAQLIDRASRALCDIITSRFDKSTKIAIFVGNGNNGNDGRALYGLLSGLGYTSRLFNVGEEIVGFEEFDVFVDAMLGIGFRGELKGSFLQTARAINQARGYKIAVDIASGLNSDNGIADKNCVNADLTVSFSGLKRGQLLGDGLDVSGEVVVADIGFLAKGEVMLLEASDVVFRARRANSHKGDYGKVAIIGGNSSMLGAPILSAMAVAALRSGCGLTKLIVPKSMLGAYAERALEWTLDCLDDEQGDVIFNQRLSQAIYGYDCVAVGMGMGNNPHLPQIIDFLLKRQIKLVLDADALNAIARSPQILEGRRAQIIMTPHAMEFCRLANISLDELKQDPIYYARNYARNLGNNAKIILKGASTIITDGADVVISANGNPVLAKGGSGDVLSGITASLFASYDIDTASTYAPFVLGEASKRAFACYGNSAIASDIVKSIRI